ncbi:RsmB/NOP family class I SAM-dependent RNA methyltransferase [Sphingomonas morindae]|uniref:RsmB/NOP family class I SAM-dependent RNA methyltransferase n=1 Tax=Sphingomonas morindae TaxID=1541170 RepID=A0ABY4X902_9SPHN|nr:RsmB/NOP family class I SAM-dependent RNA methyltransferase [Sphingomonas morindae]USI73161.1 RsmB/NOP family class I SAM-dependent RNA methyltransferase [Sphingomonas morindae]
MTPQARAQAAIDIVDGVIAAARAGGAAADTLIQRYFAARRYAGAKDRRAVRALVYGAIRRAGDPPASGRAAMLGLAEDMPELTAWFDGSRHAPAPIRPDEPRAIASEAPAWLAGRLDGLGLTGRAPLDLRVNRLKIRREALDLPDAVPTPFAPDGLRLPQGAAVERLEAYAQGLFEVQDEGSQLVARACGAQPGQAVVDLCAGAGGKTLALAADMADRGRLLACDADRARLARLAPRAARAGVTIAEPRLLDAGREADALADWREAADLVVIDAPCSGTGTWRRNPEARWRLTPDRLARLQTVQARLLRVGAALVRPGGALAYITCSLLDEEGVAPIAAFLEEAPHWRVDGPALPAGAAHGPGWRLTPADAGTDGFFIARLRRSC